MPNGMPAILLDISRTVSRAGNGQYSGIDRVEQAYISHLLGEPGEVWFLSRGLAGFAILDKAGMQAFRSYVTGEKPMQRPDLLSRFSLRQSPELKKSESTMRRLSRAVTPRKGLSSLIRRHLPGGFTYLNVSHSNRSEETLSAIRRADVGKMAFMIHDIIPLTHPQFSRDGVPETFAEQLLEVARQADLLIFNSASTETQTLNWLKEHEPKLATVTALLGRPKLAKPETTTTPHQPYFVALGTIEPRKNHSLLLSIWQKLYENRMSETPRLYIVGRRGWNNETVFDQLDTTPFMDDLVFETATRDHELSALLANAQALLFPSFAEGFGLPVAEAMSLGCPVICSDLPALHEVGRDFPTYLDPDDEAAWHQAISKAATKPTTDRQPHPVPTWQDHFQTIMPHLSEPSP